MLIIDRNNIEKIAPENISIVTLTYKNLVKPTPSMGVGGWEELTLSVFELSDTPMGSSPYQSCHRLQSSDKLASSDPDP